MKFSEGKKIFERFARRTEKNIFLPLISQSQLSSPKACSTIKDLANLLFIENYYLACSVPEVCTAFLLFLTLPVTVATAERSFSKLTLIKNYLRSTMSHERLVGLSVLSIESDIARSIDVKEVVKVFAAKNARRQQYINK